MTAPIDIANDSILKFAQWTLWFCGAMYILLGLGLVLAFSLPLVIASSQQSGAEGGIVMAIVMALVMFAVCGGIAAANFAAAWGLGKRKGWAWVLTLIIGALYAPSGCMPLGALLLYAMLRTGFKDAYEADAAGAVPAPAAF